jgi:DNA-binding beta-propeller fold protein YncE
MVRDGAGRELPLRNEALSRVDLAARPELYDAPWDATPSPDGDMIYFTASARFGAGVFAVPASGGEVTEVATGDPFVAPLGLAASTDGQMLYVADPGAAAGQGEGQLFAVSISDGGVHPLVEGLAPRGVEVKAEDGADMVYFTGTASDDGAVAVWKLPAAGGEPQVVAKGAPLVEPMGVAIANDGTVYVVDAAASGNGLGSVFRIRDGVVESIADYFRAGAPAGATLTLDESVLLVSALDTNRDSAQVLLIELASGQKGVITTVISANSGSGGVHRAHNSNFFAWADAPAPGRRPGVRQSQQGRQSAGVGGGVYALQ